MCSVLEDSELIRRELFGVLLLPRFNAAPEVPEHTFGTRYAAYKMPSIKDESGKTGMHD